MWRIKARDATGGRVQTDRFPVISIRTKSEQCPRRRSTLITKQEESQASLPDFNKWLPKNRNSLEKFLRKVTRLVRTLKLRQTSRDFPHRLAIHAQQRTRILSVFFDWNERTKKKWWQRQIFVPVPV